MATFYYDNINGDDENDGLTEYTPKKTAPKLMSEEEFNKRKLIEEKLKSMIDNYSINGASNKIKLSVDEFNEIVKICNLSSYLDKTGTICNFPVIANDNYSDFTLIKKGE